MNSTILALLMVFLMLFFVAGCEMLQKKIVLEETPEEAGAEEEMPEEEVQPEQPAEEPAAEAEEPVKTPEEPAEVPAETPETPEEQSSEVTTIVTVTPKTVKPTELVTLKVTPNTEQGYKTTVKIYDENEERVKQVYIQGCGSICKKEKSTSFKVEYDWKGDYCTKVVDVETNKEVGDCFKVE